MKDYLNNPWLIIGIAGLILGFIFYEVVRAIIVIIALLFITGWLIESYVKPFLLISIFADLCIIFISQVKTGFSRIFKFQQKACY